MAENQVIWTGAKWVVGSLSAALSAITIPASKNMLNKWREKGDITFHDDPSTALFNVFNQQAEFFGGLAAGSAAYLFAKTMAPQKTFPSFLLYTALQVNLLPFLYDFMIENINTIVQFHLSGLGTKAVRYTVVGYVSFMSMWASELSKFPLL
jgi:hypothetical protein